MLNYRVVLELTCPTVCACLLTLRPGVLSKTLSHMWGKLNLIMFPFSVRLLNLMNMDSLIFLAKLFKDWERFKLRDINCRNHRIFTLKCISNELVPVILRLKTTLKTEKARKITRKVEKDLLQARVKSINGILGDNTKQTELSRSKLASTVSTTIMDKCQQFIDKVSELRFLKIKERQVNKFNRLLLKKQGNITWFSTDSSLVNPQAESTSPQAASTSVPQACCSWAESAPQAASTSSPQTNSSQAVSSHPSPSREHWYPGSQHLCLQAGSSWAESAFQAASTSSPQTGSSQVDSTNSQGVSTVPP